MNCFFGPFLRSARTLQCSCFIVCFPALLLVPSAISAMNLLRANSVTEEHLVTIDVVKKSAWTGERVPVLVELRTRGTFAGAVSFDLPELAGCLLIKVGNPVIGSREILGINYFTQTHEFAIFSQRAGSIVIPRFTVRYSTRDGFTGPITDNQAYVPSAQVEIRRPPGSERLNFVIATSELKVTENWSLAPGTARVGDVIKRTISQQAIGIPGMALAPTSEHFIPGVRTYSKQPEIRDVTERGTFAGQRRDVVSYLLQKPGTHLLPGLDFYWWNPVSNELKITSLPSAEFIVVGLADSTTSASPAVTGKYLKQLWATAGIIALTIIMRRRLVACFHLIKRAIDSTYRGLPPLNP